MTQPVKRTLGELYDPQGQYNSSPSEFSSSKRQRTESSQSQSSSSSAITIPRGWIAEWSGDKGRQIIHAVVLNSTPLCGNTTHLVVQYLRKTDIYGLADLERAAGGRSELQKILGEEYECADEHPIEAAIDDEMQKDLRELFDAESLRRLPADFTKVTHLYSLYWCPEGMSAQKAHKIVKKHGQKFFHDRYNVRYEKNYTWADYWLQFPNGLFCRGERMSVKETLTPPGYEFPRFSFAVFCVFMKYVYTGARILQETCTYCLETDLGTTNSLAVGGFAAEGLRDNECCEDWACGNIGVAYTRKYAYGS